jgi:hypothetical protein
MVRLVSHSFHNLAGLHRTGKQSQLAFRKHEQIIYYRPLRVFSCIDYSHFDFCGESCGLAA